MLGEWDQCFIVDAPNNFLAYRGTLAQEWSVTKATIILPAVDMPLFERLVQQEIRTAGPYKWQVRWWAKLVRAAMYQYSYGRWGAKVFYRPPGLRHGELAESVQTMHRRR